MSNLQLNNTVAMVYTMCWNNQIHYVHVINKLEQILTEN